MSILGLKIKRIHPDLVLPSKATDGSAAFDIIMPVAGKIEAGKAAKINLGFAAAIPKGYAAIIMPRSGVGSRELLKISNTAGLIDSDYRGEWVANLHLHDPEREFSWNAGDRLLQFYIAPIPEIEVIEVDSLDDTVRGAGGFGHTGN